MDRLTSMAVFVKVADLGSFAAAAHELRLSPTMIGKHVRFLEERLGSLLINRSTRRQSLTELGRNYLEHCRQPRPATRSPKRHSGPRAASSVWRHRLRSDLTASLQPSCAS
jgi:DNA-binding transcriptional LysR family regulator